jgi:hypothetical protein
MKKSVLMMALVAFLFSMNVTAQDKEPKQKKKVKTEKTCSAEEKKSCDKDGKGEKRGGCCAAKKEEKK